MPLQTPEINGAGPIILAPVQYGNSTQQLTNMELTQAPSFRTPLMLLSLDENHDHQGLAIYLITYADHPIGHSKPRIYYICGIYIHPVPPYYIPQAWLVFQSQSKPNFQACHTMQPENIASLSSP